jgi:hypothetical protein
MNESAPPPAPAVETPAERAEKAAIRRRWIGLAELVGVAALLVSVAGLWLSWSDRQADQADKAKTSAEASLVTFTASGSGDTLNLSDDAHRIQEITVTFPPALGVDAQTGVSPPKIELAELGKALRAATDGGPDNRSGRVPVLITAIWWDGDTKRTDKAIYQVPWRTWGRLGRDRGVALEGASLAERGGSAARLDSLWKAEKPAS